MEFFKIQKIGILCVSLVFYVFAPNSAISRDPMAAQMLQDVNRYYRNFILGANKSVVLVLGNKAAGKSVLSRLLTTNSDQINVKGTKLEFNGQRNIPETIVPTLLIDSKTNTSFYDCPVVDDASAEIAIDITGALTIQKLLAYAREFKILFVITAESMSNANDTGDFIKLAGSAVDLIRDTRKYSDGIALIVRTNELNGTAIDYDEKRDRELIDKCIDFLKRTQLKLARPTFQSSVEEDDERTNREKISFISALFKNERIKILRIPMRVDALRREKDAILTMVTKELRFVTKDDNDFLCKINEKSKQHTPKLIAELKNRLESVLPKSIAVIHGLYVESENRDAITLNVMAEILSFSERLNPNILKIPANVERSTVISYELQKDIEIFEFLKQFNANDEMHVLNISMELRSQLRRQIDETFSVEMIAILNAIKAIYFQKVKDYYLEIDEINRIVIEAHAKFSTITNDTREIFMTELFNLVNELEIDGLNGNMRRLSRNLEFMIVLGDTNQPIAEYLADEFDETKTYFEHLKIWYEFVHELRDRLSIYAVQQNKHMAAVAFMNVYIIGDDADTVGPHIIELQTPLSYLANDTNIDRNAIENVRVSRYMLKALQTVWSSSMANITIECAPNRMRVKGDFISIRHAIEMANDCWRLAKRIDIFALNTVFIDADIDKRDENVNITIISPTWQIISMGDQANAQPLTRQILLIGKNVSEELPVAQNGRVENNRNGTNGMQGIRGGAGGNILCIGHWFIDDEHFRIDVSGGIGGPGQIGGNGTDGVRGKVPPTLTKADNQALGFKCDDRETFSFQNGTQYTNYTCFGKPPVPAGHGGDGGCGGFGGDPGAFHIIGLQNLTTHIKVVNRTGETGPNAGGGIGGQGTTFGDNTHFQSHYTEGLFGTKLFEKWYRIAQGTDPGATIDRGLNGTFPSHCSTVQSKPVHYDVQPSIIAYKQYVWRNLAQSAWKTNLTNFIGKMQNNHAIRSFFHVNGYIDEFLRLENDYFHLKNDIDFMPMYQFVRQRFEQCHSSLENPKMWHLFYAALISKMLAIRNHTQMAAVSDLFSDESQMKNNIAILNVNRIEYIKRMRNASKNALVARIQSVRKLSESALTTISQIFTQSNETHRDECIEDLQAQMIRQQIITPMNIIQSFLSLMIQDAGALITDASIENAQNISIESNVQRPLVVVATTSALYTAQISLIAKHFQYKSHQLKELLEDFDGILKQDTSTKLNKIQQLVADLSSEMNDILANDHIPTDNLTSAFIYGQSYLANAIENVKLQFETGTSVEKASKLVERMKSLLKCFALGIEPYRNCRSNPKKLTESIEKIDQFYGLLRKWTEYEQSIYRSIMPPLKQMDESIQSAIAHNDTHFRLDVNSWNVRPALTELSTIFDRIRRRPLFDHDLKRSIDLIKQEIKIICGLYNHIQVYLDRTKLIALLENLDKNSDVRVTSDAEIDAKMAILNDSIYANLMLELCHTTVQMLKMRAFPFVHDYLTLCKMPSPPLTLTNSSSQLVKQAFLQNIDDLTHKIGFRREDVNIFNTTFNFNQPFYHWKYQNYKDEIQRLLNGESVIFNADISTENPLKNQSAIDMNALKFKQIQIDFHLINETKQNILNDVLKNFRIVMTMIGNSYFKCNRKIYSVPIDVDIRFSFKIVNRTTTFIELNGIDSKLMQTTPFLSPFTVWNIQLVSDLNDFNPLKPFENEEIELKLWGDGDFVKNDALGQQACNDELNKNYHLDRIL